ITTRFFSRMMQYKNKICITGSFGPYILLTNHEAWEQGMGYDEERNFQRKSFKDSEFHLLEVNKTYAMVLKDLFSVEAATAKAEKLAKAKYEGTEKFTDGTLGKTIFKAVKLTDARFSFAGKKNRIQLELTYGVSVREYVSRTSEPGSKFTEVFPFGETPERKVVIRLSAVEFMGLKNQRPPAFLKRLAPKLPKGYTVGGWVKLPKAGKELTSLLKAFEKGAPFVPFSPAPPVKKSASRRLTP
ncbi:hypothetical protein KJ865_07350, partial [Myxococcota bacterium]|nr:hypothetical protein [Myxococcota bacterium]